MERFQDGQRVTVAAVLRGEEEVRLAPARPGTVRRRRIGDNGAWIALDERLSDESLHPFSADDETRDKHVLSFPDLCDALRAEPTSSPAPDRSEP